MQRAVKKRLDVPLFLQPRGKPYCGPTCAQMILGFYGKNKPLGKIIAQLLMAKGGVDVASLGTLFLKNGFSVTLGLWLQNFPNRFVDLKGEDLRVELRRWCRRAISRSDKTGENVYRRTLLHFLDSGGEAFTRPVALSEIILALKMGHPPILNLDVAMLYRLKRKKGAGHYVVPIAANGKTIVINDPNSLYGGVKTYATEKILHAIYTWHGAVLFIRPR